MNYNNFDAFTPVDGKVAQALLEAVEPYKAALGIDDIELTPTEDHAGDPVVYARFKHRLVKPRLSTRSLWEMESVLRDVARRSGERRFVHMRHEFADEQLLETYRDQ